MNKTKPSIISIDIGATKIACGLVNGLGEVSQFKSIPTNAREGAEVLITRVIQLCRTVLGEIDWRASKTGDEPSVAAIGVSSAGQIDSQAGRVIYATDNLPGWTGMEIKNRIEAELPLPVFVENDVNCVALGEQSFGAGKGYRHILCLAIGTGIGGALIINGELYRGWKGAAGELGHICIDYRGRPCNCGARGCLETYVAGPGIEKEFLRRLSLKSPDVSKNDLSRVPLEEIAQLAACGDVDAQMVIRDAGYYLGYGLFGLLNTLNPEIVVIGGGVVKAGQALLDDARRVVAANALAPMRETPIVAAQLEGAHASLVGVAVFSWQQLGK